jgi:hypothetical protein
MMPKPPDPGKPAAELTVSERVLLFCLASDTDWVKAGVAPATAPHMLIRNLVERSAADFVLTDQGRAVPDRPAPRKISAEGHFLAGSLTNSRAARNFDLAPLPFYAVPGCAAGIDERF